eukprot:2497151-Amphidinium_carterae.1
MAELGPRPRPAPECKGKRSRLDCIYVTSLGQALLDRFPRNSIVLDVPSCGLSLHHGMMGVWQDQGVCVSIAIFDHVFFLTMLYLGGKGI